MGRIRTHPRDGTIRYPKVPPYLGVFIITSSLGIENHNSMEGSYFYYSHLSNYSPIKAGQWYSAKPFVELEGKKGSCASTYAHRNSSVAPHRRYADVWPWSNEQKKCEMHLTCSSAVIPMIGHPQLSVGTFTSIHHLWFNLRKNLLEVIRGRRDHDYQQSFLFSKSL